MTKQTLTKRIARKYDLARAPDGKPIVVARETPLPPAPLTKKIVQCGIYEVTVNVSEGQIINEKKVCKRFLQEQRKINR